MLRFWPSCLLTLTALATGGCDDPFAEPGCTLIGCSSGASLTVTRAAAWAGGEYALAVQLGAREHRCLFTLPLPPGARPNEISLAEQYLACTPELPVQSPSERATVYRVNSPPSSVCPASADAGAAQTCGSEHYRLSLGLDGSPADVGLRLSVGDAVLLDERRTLEYETSYPNGPECGGPCRSAAVTFDVVEP